MDTVEGKSNETGLVWRTDRVVWRGVTLPAYLPARAQRDPVLAHGLAAPHRTFAWSGAGSGNGPASGFSSSVKVGPIRSRSIPWARAPSN